MGVFAWILRIGFRRRSRRTPHAGRGSSAHVVHLRRTVRVVAAAPPDQPSRFQRGDRISGRAWVIDGDTIIINKIRIRIAGIDAPEIDQPFGQKAKRAMHAICKGRTIHAHMLGETSHGREVARCLLNDGRDIAGLLVAQGLALDWQYYSGGRYRALEPPDARRKLWRVLARPGHR